MKIRFRKHIVVDMETQRGDIYPKEFQHWAEVRVDSIYYSTHFATIQTDEGNILHEVPLAAFEKVEEKKHGVSL
jgi:hypothetical protein